MALDCHDLVARRHSVIMGDPCDPLTSIAVDGAFTASKTLNRGKVSNALTKASSWTRKSIAKAYCLDRFEDSSFLGTSLRTTPVHIAQRQEVWLLDTDTALVLWRRHTHLSGSNHSCQVHPGAASDQRTVYDSANECNWQLPCTAHLQLFLCSHQLSTQLSCILRHQASCALGHVLCPHTWLYSVHGSQQLSCPSGRYRARPEFHTTAAHAFATHPWRHI